MTLKEFYKALPRDRREQFARRAGTTTAYIEIHLLRDKKKIPQRKLMLGLAEACREFGADIGYGDLLSYFYGPGEVESGCESHPKAA